MYIINHNHNQILHLIFFFYTFHFILYEWNFYIFHFMLYVLIYNFLICIRTLKRENTGSPFHRQGNWSTKIIWFSKISSRVVISSWVGHRSYFCKLISNELVLSLGYTFDVAGEILKLQCTLLYPIPRPFNWEPRGMLWWDPGQCQVF